MSVNGEKKTYVMTDDEVVMDVTPPTKLRDVPTIDDVVPGHTSVSQADQQEYINELNDRRIAMLNGLCLGARFLSCDYCRTMITSVSRRYCTTCHNDMCELCFVETDEAIALANGATNYALRKDALAACRGHELVERCIGGQTGNTCDVCGETNIGVDTTTCCPVPYYGSRVCNKDCCHKCSTTDEGREFITENGLQLVNPRHECDYSGYGSMLDWVPVLTDGDNMVLFNRNADRPVQYACMSIDDHGRCGFYSLPLEWTLEKIIAFLAEPPTAVDSDGSDSDGSGSDSDEVGAGWDSFYQRPIKLLMHSLNMHVHYG